MESTLRLFKALPVEDKNKNSDKNYMAETVPKGFILAPEVIANYPSIGQVMDLVNKAYGRDASELNQSFHKSWNKIKTAYIEQLVLEQVIHYFTTYGFEELGIYNEESVYIPAERLEIPQVEDGLRLVVIKGYTKEELREKLIGLLSAGVALHENTIADVLNVASFVDFSEDDVELVKNKEVKAALYDYFGIVPESPIEFLRYVVYRATNKTLLIKNADLINEIKSNSSLDVARYFDLYDKEFGFARLSEIFYRYKPLFLAFRTNTKMKRNINNIRRLAVANHKPMQEDLLNTVTARLAHREAPERGAFMRALNDASIFRKIRLAYALKFRTTDAESILYRVRNGKSYAKEFYFDNPKGAQTLFIAVMASVVKDLEPQVKDKKIFIPQGVKYGLPATEKQFTGNIPSGSYVELKDNMVCGVHWENQSRHRIDLDLSMMSVDGKIGWDNSYRSSGRDVLFSGDLTDAPKPRGASEFFYVSEGARGVWSMYVNYYNFRTEVPVPFKIIVAHEKPVNPESHYTVDPNNIVALSNSVISVRQKNLGIVVADEESTHFYFAESDLGRGITVRGRNYTEQARDYLVNYYTDSIILNDVLTEAGALLVGSPEEADIDLSPEVIDKTTILELIQQKG